MQNKSHLNIKILKERQSLKYLNLFSIIVFLLLLTPVIVNAEELSGETEEKQLESDINTDVSNSVKEMDANNSINQNLQQNEEFENTEITESPEDTDIPIYESKDVSNNIEKENDFADVKPKTDKESPIIPAALTKNDLKLGVRGTEVKKMKERLVQIGFGTHWKNPTTYYGPDTVKVVEEFQSYYSLKVNGIMGKASLDKLDSIINSPYQHGKRSNKVLELKKDLMKIGFGTHWKNPTTLYGPDTEKVVKEFQKVNNLVINGIIDEVTLQHLKQLLPDGTMKQGDQNPEVKKMKEKLVRIGFGTHWANPTTLFGPDTVRVVEEFQSYYSLKINGIMDKASLEKLDSVIESPYQRGKKSNKVLELKIDLMKVGFGTHWINPTTLYGPDTEKVVLQFQKTYKLVENGIVDEVTARKITQLKDQALKYGMRNDKVKAIKEDLVKVGFGTHWKNPSTYYGQDTVNVVKEFQKYYSLHVDGVMHNQSVNKLNQILSSPLQKGKRSSAILQLKKDLMKIGFGTHWTNPTTLYGPDTEMVVREFQKKNGLVINGIADEVTLAKIVQLLNAKEITFYTDYKLTLNQALDIQMDSQNTLNLTDKYRKDPAYVSAKYLKINGNQAEATGTVNVRAGAGTNYHIFGKLKKGDKVTVISKGSSWHEISYSAWREPTRADMKAYLDPSKNDKFQHLRLDSSVGVSASGLNKVLKGKGVLADQGQAFINGSKKHGINEAYLIAHAFLETGNGTSALAKGIEVGKDKKEELVLVTSKNRKNLTAIKKTYNMFGIGAEDDCAIECGAKKAYEEGWFTPQAAIEGGAKWIGVGYIYNEYKQNTLYKMKWNPRMGEGYAWKQYATDIGWATKQVTNIKNIYNQLNNPSYHYDIAKYN